MKSGEELDERWARNFGAAQIRHALKSRAFQHLGGQCKICGYDKCSAGMDFHHLDPRDKEFTISQRMTSFEGIRKELDKCVPRNSVTQILEGLTDSSCNSEGP